MEIWQQTPDLWWAEATQEQRRAVMAAIRDWGLDQVDRDDLDPYASRRSHGLLAQELKGLVGPEHEADRELLRSWYRLPNAVKSTWVCVVGCEFEPASRQEEVAWEVAQALTPPPFATLKDHEQVSLLGQIACEIDRNLTMDPKWYSRESAAYGALSRSIHDLLNQVNLPEGGQCALQWSHMEPRERRGVLGEIGQFARMVARSEGLEESAQRPLLELARSIERVLTPERVR